MKLEGNQIWLVREIAESVSRMIIGQPSDLLEQVRNSDGKHSFFNYEESRTVTHLITDMMGLHRNASGGVGWSEEGDILWDICQVTRHRAAWDNAIANDLTNSDGSRNWSNMMGVSYDEPGHYGSEPLPVISGKEGDYTLTMNERQANLLKRAMETVLDVSVCRFEKAVQWPVARDGIEIPESNREYANLFMTEITCKHLGIKRDERLLPEDSPVAENIGALMKSLKPVPVQEKDISPQP